MIKLSDYISKRLIEYYKVKNVFLISGGGAMHLNDSIGRYIPYTTCHHEQACAIAAEGYSRVNNYLSVVNVTTGPGGINCLNGVFGQWTDSVPVLYISGQVKASTIMNKNDKIRQLGDQEVDIISIVKPITKYAVTILNSNEVKYHLDRAIYKALQGRPGPVWLNIPLDIQSSFIEEKNLIDFIPPTVENYDCKIDSIIEHLQKAKKPLIVVGHGVRISSQIENLKKLLEKLNCPVVTTFNGFDLIEDGNPYYIGRIGTIGQRAGNFALQNADVILFLGTRNNIRQISYNWENYAKNAYKIVIDIDETELKKDTLKPNLAIHTDLKIFLPELFKKAVGLKVDNWLKWCLDRKEKYRFNNVSEYKQTGNKINVYHFIHKVSEYLPEKSIVILSNATPTICMFQTSIVKTGQRIISNSGNASMGYELPAAIGSCIANNKKEVFCIAGDGSIMMNIQELQTIKHYNLPIKIFVINNLGYSSIRQTQKNFFDGRMTGSGIQSGVSVPDFSKVAEAFGIDSIKLENPDMICDTIKKVINHSGPILCEVIVNPEYIFVPKLSAKKLPDGTMVSPSLEDMYPFLDRNEFKENIL